MTADPRRPATPATARTRTRLGALLREFWHAMRAAHHERVPH